MQACAARHDSADLSRPDVRVAISSPPREPASFHSYAVLDFSIAPSFANLHEAILPRWPKDLSLGVHMTRPIDTTTIGAQVTDSWFSKTLTTINDVNLRFRVMEDAEASFHVHPSSPECFFVVSGQVTIDTEGACETLGPGQFFRVEPGLSHRARVRGRATLLVLDQLPTAA